MKIAREALPIALILVGVFAAGAFLLHPLIAVPGVLLFVFTLWFFRDPERTTPRVPGALISPADGKIIRTGPDRISVFMNVFNVHICRAPSAGVLETVEHKDGRFQGSRVRTERTSSVRAHGRWSGDPLHADRGAGRQTDRAQGSGRSAARGRSASGFDPVWVACRRGLASGLRGDGENRQARRGRRNSDRAMLGEVRGLRAGLTASRPPARISDILAMERGRQDTVPTGDP